MAKTLKEQLSTPNINTREKSTKKKKKKKAKVSFKKKYDHLCALESELFIKFMACKEINTNQVLINTNKVITTNNILNLIVIK